MTTTQSKATTPAATHGVPPHSLVARTQELTPLIRAHRAAAEEACRLTPAVHTALAHTGLYRAIAPLEVGGDELSFPDQVRVAEALGYADPSVAWCVINSWGAGIVAGRITPEARQRLFADPDVFFGFGFAPGGRATPSAAGYRLHGEWPVVSGCQLARWFVLSSRMLDGEQPRPVHSVPLVKSLVVAAEHVEILDTWSDVVGLRGSGSHAVRIADAPVPADFVCGLSDPLLIDRPAYRLNLFLYQAGVGAVLLGTARAAVDALIDQASHRVSVAVGRAWRDWPNIQDTLVTAVAEVTAARAGLIEAVERAWEAVQDQPEVPRELRALVYALTHHAHRTAREAVSRVYTAGSIDALHRSHVLEQALRDVHAMSVNWERYRQVYYDAGRVLMGLDPLAPMY
jgi:alkylation response protein AidB-like acyl-CoA dehydrogenase